MSKKEQETQWKNNMIKEIDKTISCELKASNESNKLKQKKIKLEIYLGLQNTIQPKEIKGLYGSKEFKYKLNKAIENLISIKTTIFDSKDHNENCKKLREVYGSIKYIKLSWEPYLLQRKNEFDEHKRTLDEYKRKLDEHKRDKIKIISEKENLEKLDQNLCPSAYKYIINKLTSLREKITSLNEKFISLENKMIFLKVDIESYESHIKRTLENLQKKKVEYKSLTKEEMSGKTDNYQNIWKKIPKETDTDYPMINDNGQKVMIDDDNIEVVINDDNEDLINDADMDLSLAPVTELTQTLQESNLNSIEAFLEDVHYGKHIATAGVINEKTLEGDKFYPAAEWFQAWQSYIEKNQLSDMGVLNKKQPHVSFGVQFAKKGKVLQYFHIEHSSKEGNSYKITMERVHDVISDSSDAAVQELVNKGPRAIREAYIKEQNTDSYTTDDDDDDDDPYATDDEIIVADNYNTNQSKKRKRNAVDSSKSISPKMAEDLSNWQGSYPTNYKRVPDNKFDVSSFQNIDTDSEEEWGL